MLGLSRTDAAGYGRDGICINSVCPGVARTPCESKLRPQSDIPRGYPLIPILKSAGTVANSRLRLRRVAQTPTDQQVRECRRSRTGVRVLGQYESQLHHRRRGRCWWRLAVLSLVCSRISVSSSRFDSMRLWCPVQRTRRTVSTRRDDSHLDSNCIVKWYSELPRPQTAVRDCEMPSARYVRSLSLFPRYRSTAILKVNVHETF